MRKRIYLSVDAKTHELITRITKEYGFRSVCQMLMTLLWIFVRRVLKGEELADYNEDAVSEIDQMFDEFTNWTPTPENTEPPAGPSKIGHSPCQRTRHTRD